MGMEKNSSSQTRKRAADLAKVIGANHLDFECVSVFPWIPPDVLLV